MDNFIYLGYIRPNFKSTHSYSCEYDFGSKYELLQCLSYSAGLLIGLLIITIFSNWCQVLSLIEAGKTGESNILVQLEH